MSFYITVSNGLLKDDHEIRMGTAVWQFMWCLDRITRIDDDGVGWVLGGKPVNLADIANLRSEDTVSRNLNRLAKAGYIRLRHTPRGIVIGVNKAKKSFGKNADQGSAKMPKHYRKNAEPNIRQDQMTNAVGHSAAAAPRRTWRQKRDEDGERVDDTTYFIDWFAPLNPNHYRLFAMRSQREAAERMIRKHGVEKLVGAAKFLAANGRDRFCPTITTPIQLEQKLGALVAYAAKQRSKNNIVGMAI